MSAGDWFGVVIKAAMLLMWLALTWLVALGVGWLVAVVYDVFAKVRGSSHATVAGVVSFSWVVALDLVFTGFYIVPSLIKL